MPRNTKKPRWCRPPYVIVYWREDDNDKFNWVRVPEGDVTWNVLQSGEAVLTGRSGSVSRGKNRKRLALLEVDPGKDIGLWVSHSTAAKFGIEVMDGKEEA